MDLDGVWHVIWAWVNRDGVSHSDSEVLANDLVHQDLLVVGFSLLVDESDADSLSAFLA